MNFNNEQFDRQYVIGQLVDILNQIIENKEAETNSACNIDEVA